MIIGVIGYSTDSCKTEKARGLVSKSIASALAALIASEHLGSIIICSGLTNLGIPALAYEVAESHNLHTMGIACAKAANYECYPVDEKIIVGTEWGDETDLFLEKLSALVQIGGGEQSKKEAKLFQERYPNKPYIYAELTREGT